VPIVGDARSVLQDLNAQVNTQTHVEWVRQIDEWRDAHPCNVIRDCPELLPQFVIRRIYEVTGGEATIVTGVGQHQMWSAHHYWYTKPNQFISCGGLGAMGFELPAAMGAKVALPNDAVWCVAGDGGIQMTIQELGTIAQEKLAVKIAIMDNGYLGMVRQWQELFYKRRYVSTPLSNPDFIKIAEAYGIPALRVTNKKQVAPAIEKAMACDGPFLIDFVVEPEENVYPMVPPGASLSEVIEAPGREKYVTLTPGVSSNL